MQQFAKQGIVLATPDYELIDALDPASLGWTDFEWSLALDAPVAVVGKGAAGKTRFCRAVVETWPQLTTFVPVDTTRPPRDDEVNGEDINCIPDEEFETRRLDGQYLFTYWVGAPASPRRKRSGLPLAKLSAAILLAKRVLLIVPAPLADLLGVYFPVTAIVVVKANPVDHERYLRWRGLTPEDAAGKSDIGVVYEGEMRLAGVIDFPNEPWRLYRQLRVSTLRDEDGTQRSVKDVITTARFHQRLRWDHWLQAQVESVRSEQE